MLHPALTLAVVLAFAAIHVLSPRLDFLDTVPRSRWLSTAGGVSVAYVFVHMLPELAARQADIRAAHRLFRAEAEIFVVALIGLVVFYGLERLARVPRRGAAGSALDDPGAPEAEEETTSRAVFWLHVASFAAYNGLIGYLLVHREETDLRGLAFYAVALGLHFLVNDRGLRQHYRDLYRTRGRWFLAAAVLLGWLLGTASTVQPWVVAILFAFLAGGVVLNVLKEELPEERESRFSAFALGAAGYAAVLLVV